MDAVASIINKELHRLMIDGIKYEKLTTGITEWSMQLFKDREILSYLNNRFDVNKSIYDAIVYDSEIERKFAEDLDKREDIRLFVKLPNWFRVETPIGEYNPDWAIVKHNDETIYLVRETKGTKNYEQLRNSEADKIKCGRKHFEALDTNFDVVTSAKEI
jgi:type III restriction enzyme